MLAVFIFVCISSLSVVCLSETNCSGKEMLLEWRDWCPAGGASHSSALNDKLSRQMAPAWSRDRKNSYDAELIILCHRSRAISSRWKCPMFMTSPRTTNELLVDQRHQCLCVHRHTVIRLYVYATQEVYDLTTTDTRHRVCRVCLEGPAEWKLHH